jgi:hypothetical protein
MGNRAQLPNGIGSKVRGSMLNARGCYVGIYSYKGDPFYGILIHEVRNLSRLKWGLHCTQPYPVILSNICLVFGKHEVRQYTMEIS